MSNRAVSQGIENTGLAVIGDPLASCAGDVLKRVAFLGNILLEEGVVQ